MSIQTNFYLKMGNCLSFKSGDNIDKDIFFEKHRGYFISAAYSRQIGNNRENAKDMVGDLYILFKTKIKNCDYDDENHAKRAIARFFSSMLKEKSNIIYKYGAVDFLEAKDDSPHTDISAPMNIIKEQINTLPNNLKQIITLRYLNGLSIEEIVKKLNIRKEYVSRMSCQAINLIKRNLGIEINTLNPSRSVLQYTINDEPIKEYPSLSEAARKTGTNVGSISECCHGHRETEGGYKWSFIKIK